MEAKAPPQAERDQCDQQQLLHSLESFHDSTVARWSHAPAAGIIRRVKWLCVLLELWRSFRLVDPAQDVRCGQAVQDIARFAAQRRGLCSRRQGALAPVTVFRTRQCCEHLSGQSRGHARAPRQIERRRQCLTTIRRREAVARGVPRRRPGTAAKTLQPSVIIGFFR
jgi:hypothetical protein